MQLPMATCFFMLVLMSSNPLTSQSLTRHLPDTFMPSQARTSGPHLTSLLRRTQRPRQAQTRLKSGRQSGPSGWTRVPIRGDGNCLFRALAQGNHRLSAGQEKALSQADERQVATKLRQAICRELQSRRDDIEPFLEGEFAVYIRRMESEATWGGEPELAVAPHCLHRPIDVFTQRTFGSMEQISSYGDEYKPAAAVRLFFHQGGHYDLLVPAAPKSKL